ncbi:phosphatidylglycerophosphatase A family protein [Jannaschia seohaensis]|uniref:Phosphatidylglycerophosphatase A n=1 Tax=Jannaschia seohaensis TaxID=475081 RepID=A0A2Y9AZM1_9RHOB|nr:phosphatidylglycerophosphatase A [Jannaschia seohaensis]PWJ15871.1 phosphatidylglycerophosphatase A [Jannaschia seohaensis]SSA49576.1 phosphatidylglycerophosphatase A [Jannaschia seohaensis]
MTLAGVVATVLGAGHLRPAPGTWGTLAALPLAWLAMQGGALFFTVATAFMLPLGLWATRKVTEGREEHDPSEIVIDELLGVWIALIPLAWGAQNAGVPVERLWPGWIAAFLLFRLFDIWKPGPVGWADRRPDEWGVMLDDAVAGAMAAIGVIVLAALAHA